MKNVLLMILDGWGEGKHDQTNAIYTAGQPHIDKLKESNPNSTLSACGEDVGLPGARRKVLNGRETAGGPAEGSAEGPVQGQIRGFVQ